MRSLLLVDANPMTRRLVELTFAHEQVRVIVADDGLQAEALVRAERPDVVIAEHEASGLSGYELAALLKAEPGLSHIPVMLLTGAYDPVDATRMAACGCAGVLVKPFDPREMVARVTDLMRTGVTPDPSTSDPPTSDPPTAPTSAEQTQRPERVNAAGSVEELFDRLDEVLGTRRRSRMSLEDAGPRHSQEEAGTLPTLDRLLGSEPDTATPPSEVPPVAPLPEQVSDQISVEELRRRVLDRLSSDEVTRVVDDIVQKVVERMVEDERARMSAKP